VWSHKGPTLKGIRNWAPPGTQLFFPGLRSDTSWTGWYIMVASLRAEFDMWPLHWVHKCCLQVRGPLSTMHFVLISDFSLLLQFSFLQSCYFMNLNHWTDLVIEVPDNGQSPRTR
jgi:hypothetical protein